MRRCNTNLRKTAKCLWQFRFAGVAVAVFAAMLLMPVAHAQITGTITGTVYDNTGAVVPGAAVSLTNQVSRDVRTTTSDTAGYFAFPSVVPGTYTVKVEAKGFKAFQQPDIELQASDKRNINATLTVGQTTEVVTVEAHTDLVPVDSPARTLDLAAADIQKLPLVTRNATTLLLDLPGAVLANTDTSTVNPGADPDADLTAATPANSPIGRGVSIGGAPFRGGTSLLMDGTNIIDEGCDCTSIAVPNPEMIQEVKVQTSAFGASSAKGPVVVDFITKSGGADYHGEGYLFARNAIFNADDWQDNEAGRSVQTGDHYYYPGGNVGGPVPLTHKKLMFWAGYEHFYQLATGGTKLEATIPTSDMIAGNFGPTAANTALCAPLGFAADTTNTAALGTACFSPSAAAGNNSIGNFPGTGPGGQTITDTAVPLDPGAQALMGMIYKWDAPNIAPGTFPGTSYNYFFPVPALENGYVFRGRGDYNFDDNNKFFVTFQYSPNNAPADGESHMWWLPGNSVRFPGGGLFNPTQIKNTTGSFLHIFSPTLTNQANAYWTYYNSPESPANFSAVTRGVVGYNYGMISRTPGPGDMVPGWNGVNNALPDFSQWDVFSQSGGSYLIKKENPAFSDDLTKVYKNHTFQTGFYYEMTGNNQWNFNPYNGGFSFGSVLNSEAPGTGTCPKSATTNCAIASNPDTVTGIPQGTGNPAANFMMGIATQYNEQTTLPTNDFAYKTFGFYLQDSWKLTRRFTLDFGTRFDHIDHWYDRDGYGNAVWVPGDIVQDLARGKPFPGVEWHAIDPSIPLSGTPNRTFHFAPRFGIAYDLFGNGNTVLRGGWGVYFFGDQVNDYSSALSMGQDSVGTSIPSNTSTLFSEVPSLPKPSSLFSPGNPSPGYILDPNDYDVSYTTNYNLTVDQKLPWNSHLEVAYEGNSSNALMLGGQVGGGGALGGGDLINVNAIPLGSFFNADNFANTMAGTVSNVSTSPENPCGSINCLNGKADYHPYGTMDFGSVPGGYLGVTPCQVAPSSSGTVKAGDCLINVYGTNAIFEMEHRGVANYNAFAVIWSKQTGRLTFNTSFLWSKALGTVANLGGAGSGIFPLGLVPGIGPNSTANLAQRLRDNYVDLPISRPYVWNTAIAYSEGKAYHGDNKLIGGVANGWTISNFTSWQAGVDLQDVNGQNLGLGFDGISQASWYGTDAGETVMPIETCNPGNGGNYKLACFAPPAVNSATFGKAVQAFGPAQLPYIGNPAFFNSDIALYKTFHITERHQVEFRVSAENWLNHPLSGMINTSPVSLHYSSVTGSGTTDYDGTTPLAQWGINNTKWEPGPSQAYGRIMEFGLKYMF